MKLFLTTFFAKQTMAQMGTFSAPRPAFPAQEQTIQYTYPTFSWTPMYPGRQSATYELTLVEVLEGQSAQATIQATPPLFRKGFIQAATFTYPVSAPALKKGSIYAWQIVASYQVGINETSVPRKLPGEVYGFRLEKAKATTCITRLTEQPQDDRFYVMDNFELRFRLGAQSHQEARGLQFLIANKQGEPITKRRIVPVKAEDVADQFVIPLRKYSAFKKYPTSNLCLEGKHPRRQKLSSKFYHQIN